MVSQLSGANQRYFFPGLSAKQLFATKIAKLGGRKRFCSRFQSEASHATNTGHACSFGLANKNLLFSCLASPFLGPRVGHILHQKAFNAIGSQHETICIERTEGVWMGKSMGHEKQNVLQSP